MALENGALVQTEPVECPKDCPEQALLRRKSSREKSDGIHTCCCILVKKKKKKKKKKTKKDTMKMKMKTTKMKMKTKMKKRSEMADGLVHSLQSKGVAGKAPVKEKVDLAEGDEDEEGLRKLSQFVRQRKGVLEEGWKVVVKKTKGGVVYKTYVSPDGTRVYSSIMEVALSLGLPIKAANASGLPHEKRGRKRKSECVEESSKKAEKKRASSTNTAAITTTTTAAAAEVGCEVGSSSSVENKASPPSSLLKTEQVYSECDQGVALIGITLGEEEQKKVEKALVGHVKKRKKKTSTSSSTTTVTATATATEVGCEKGARRREKRNATNSAAQVGHIEKKTVSPSSMVKMESPSSPLKTELVCNAFNQGLTQISVAVGDGERKKTEEASDSHKRKKRKTDNTTAEVVGRVDVEKKAAASPSSAVKTELVHNAFDQGLSQIRMDLGDGEQKKAENASDNNITTITTAPTTTTTTTTVEVGDVEEKVAPPSSLIGNIEGQLQPSNRLENSNSNPEQSQNIVKKKKKKKKKEEGLGSENKSCGEQNKMIVWENGSAKEFEAMQVVGDVLGTESFFKRNGVESTLCESSKNASFGDDPQQKDLQRLESFILKRNGILEAGWAIDVTRHESGRVSKTYISPQKQKFRSMLEVARFKGLPEKETKMQDTKTTPKKRKKVTNNTSKMLGNATSVNFEGMQCMPQNALLMHQYFINQRDGELEEGGWKRKPEDNQFAWVNNQGNVIASQPLALATRPFSSMPSVLDTGEKNLCPTLKGNINTELQLGSTLQGTDLMGRMMTFMASSPYFNNASSYGLFQPAYYNCLFPCKSFVHQSDGVAGEGREVNAIIGTDSSRVYQGFISSDKQRCNSTFEAVEYPSFAKNVSCNGMEPGSSVAEVRLENERASAPLAGMLTSDDNRSDMEMQAPNSLDNSALLLPTPKEGPLAHFSINPSYFKGKKKFEISIDPDNVHEVVHGLPPCIVTNQASEVVKAVRTPESQDAVRTCPIT